MSSLIFLRSPSIALLFIVGLSHVINGQNAAYNFDIEPNSRLIQSLGLNIPSNNPVPITTTTSRLSTSRLLSSYSPVSAPLYLQGNRPLLVSQPQAVTYLTVDERPRAARTRDRSQTVLTVSDAARRKKIQPIVPPTYSNEVDDAELKPYSFEYEANDDQSGTRSSRSEKSDGRTVTGSYSYVDADGLYRTVEYIADENGFRANVKTNEPGTSKSISTDPANTSWEVESPPEAVLARYLKY